MLQFFIRRKLNTNSSINPSIPCSSIRAISSQTQLSISPPANSNLSHLLQGRIPHPHLLQIHARVFRLNSHQNNLIATRLIGQYHPHQSLKIFRSLHNPNIFPFNAIIRVLAEDGLLSEAFYVFNELKQNSFLLPNDLTFSFLFKAVVSGSGNGVVVSCLNQVHCYVVKLGFVCESFVCSGLMMAYVVGVKDLVSARKVFDEMPERRNLTCWSSLISGYARVGLAEEGLKLFMRMVVEEEGLVPQNDTMVSVLSACSSLKGSLDVEKWANLFANCKKGDYVNVVLVYLYGKLGEVEKSREVFDEISNRGKVNILCWNAMIGAYVQNGYALEALSLFKSMLGNYDCLPNHVTMVSVLSACAEVGDLGLGIWIHEYMRNRGQRGVLSTNVNLATALIDMYSKCGSLDRACEVFDKISKKDVVSFNAMMMALAINGKGPEALILFRKMQEYHLFPNSGSFLAVLYACSHSALLDEGRGIFHEMEGNSHVSIRLEHYACYIDLLARSGYIEDALSVVSSMHCKPNNYVWGALLNGCVLHNRLELVHSISTRLVAVDPNNSGGYVMLSNSFAADRQWGNVSKLRGLMREKQVAKQPGCSWININGSVHEFLAGSASYCQMERVHQIMQLLLKEMQTSTS